MGCENVLFLSRCLQLVLDHGVFTWRLVICVNAVSSLESQKIAKYA